MPIETTKKERTVNTPARHRGLSGGWVLAGLGAALLSACVVVPPQPVVERVVPAPAYVPPPPAPVVSVYVDAPLYQPAPIAVQWAPPPMLVEVPPPRPYPYAVWTGGYWTWHGQWVWCAGRWLAPPRENYAWVQPYYEHRGEVVVFVPGYWSAPGVTFVAPPIGMHIDVVEPTVAVSASWSRPWGPPGVFVPPPPGSRPGIIVPAPIGTPPAVVVSAPPVVNVGMHVQNTTVINNVTNVTNITNVTNVTNVTVIAPPNAMANGRAYAAAVPAAPHLAAAMPALVHAAAPIPVTTAAVPAFAAHQEPVALPPAQPVRLQALAPPHPAPASMQPPMVVQPSRPQAPEPVAETMPRPREVERPAPREYEGMSPAQRNAEGHPHPQGGEAVPQEGHPQAAAPRREPPPSEAAAHPAQKRPAPAREDNAEHKPSAEQREEGKRAESEHREGER